MRALIGGIVHESSTFVADLGGPTVLADFDVHTGAELTAEFRTTNTIVGSTEGSGLGEAPGRTPRTPSSL